MRLVLMSVFAAAALAQPALAEGDKPPRPEIVAQNQATDALNRAQIEALKAVDARNAERQAAYAKAMAEHRKAVEAHAAAQALAMSSYQKAMQDWRIAVVACQAGDRNKCAPASD